MTKREREIWVKFLKKSMKMLRKALKENKMGGDVVQYPVIDRGPQS